MNKKHSGERLEVGMYNENTFEHLHRYAIATEFAGNKNILDIACGEGYGCNLLSQYASHVTGVEIDKITIEKARIKYRSPNISFLQGSIENIPCNSSGFDVVICFETLEHTVDHEKALNEIKRVLKPEGVLVISTPDKYYYSDIRNYKNPHHLKELYSEDFNRLIKKFFNNAEFFSQQFVAGSCIVPKEKYDELKIYSGDFNKLDSSASLNGKFQIAIASDHALNKYPSSIFVGEKILSKTLEFMEESFKNKITYKVGNFILWPVKKIFKLLSKSN